MNKSYFTLNKAQFEVFEKIQISKYKYIGLYGGGRSGKTTLILFIILFRAIRFPKSTHLIVRATHNSMKSSIYYQSFGNLLSFYNIKATTTYKRNDQDLTIKLDNGSVIQMKGLDHERRQESLLGNGYSTIYFNECSSLNYNLMPSLISRLAENICDINQVYFDFNPPTKAHWTYKYFIQQVDPILQIDLPYKDKMFIGKINPIDNPYIAKDYIEMQKMQGTAHYQRFVEGEFQDVGGRYIQRDYFGTYNEEIQDKEFKKIFITTDFAKSKNVKSDYNVLCVWGVDKQKNLYLLDTDRFQAISVNELPKLYRLCKQWQHGFNNGGCGLSNIYIEKPNNQDLIAILEKTYGRVISTDVMRSSNKFGRFSAVRGFIESGRVYFPSGDLAIRNIKASSWLDTYFTELESFTEDDKDYEHDDFCFAGGTLIATRRGQVAIEKVTINDYVLTPFGFQKVLFAGQTGFSECIQKRGIKATKNHRIFTFNLDFLKIDNLSDVDELCNIKICDMMKITLLRLLNLTECNINEWAEEGNITCLNPKVTQGVGVLRACMSQFGSFITKKQWKKAFIFITKMVTHLTIVLKTWSIYQLTNIIVNLKTLITKKTQYTWQKLENSQRLGIKAQKEELGTAKTPKKLNGFKTKKDYAICVEQNILSKCLKKRDIALQNAVINQGGKGEVIQNKKIKVYNLQIENVPLFYANGILVHNCDNLFDACFIASTVKFVRPINTEVSSI